MKGKDLTLAHFIDLARVGEYLKINDKVYKVVGTFGDYTLTSNGTYVEVILVRDIVKGKLTGFTHEELMKCRSVTRL